MSALPSFSFATINNMEPQLIPATENLIAQQAIASSSGGVNPVVKKKGRKGRGKGKAAAASNSGEGNSIVKKIKKRSARGSGKTCHQCRQSIEGSFARCKNPRNRKHCVTKYCSPCLDNRYGEEVEEVNLLDDWSCHKCRDRCNCSNCMIKRGLKPTGNLTREARALGFRSVAHLLDHLDAAKLDPNANNDAAVLPPNLFEGLVAWGANDFPPIPHQKDETTSEMNEKIVIDYDPAGGVSQDEIFAEVERERDTDHRMKGGPADWALHDYVDPTIFALNNVMHQFKGDFKEEKIEEIPLPPGTELKEILGIEFIHEDVGKAWQFLEFCRVFGTALDMNKGEAENILQNLVCKQNLHTLAVEFQTRLLTLIRIHKSPSLTAIDDNSSWLEVLEVLTSQSAHLLKDFPLEMLNEGLSGYCNLSLSHKLGLLNFICDEALCIDKLRSHIDEDKSNIEQQKKEAKAQVAAAKEKEKSLKQMLHDETAKRVQSNGDPGLLSEQDALLQKLETELAQAHSELLEAKGKIPKGKVSDAMRIEPEFVDGSGRRFWKLKSYEGEDAVLLQDIKIQEGDGTTIDERWFVYGPEKKHEIDEYISSRAKRTKRRKAPCKLSNASSEADVVE